MNRRAWANILVLVVVLTVVMAAVLKLQQFKVWERLFFNVSEVFGANSECLQGGCIQSYEVDMQRKVVAGAESLSSLTYNSLSGTFYTVSDDTHEVVELDRKGNVIRRIKLSGFDEVEGIEHVEGNVYLIIEEPSQKISTVVIDEKTTVIDSAVASLSVAIELNGNKGFEGLAYDRQSGNIIIAKERDPVRIYSIKGFPDKTGRPTKDLTITSDEQRTQALFLRDVSGLEFDPNTSHLYILSHESKLIIELNKEGKAISTLSLLKGQNGLMKTIPQAEGIALTPDGTLYVMSEPNLLYSFKKN
ncbi:MULTISPECIES: SdiA-regulated domain-containing protein [Pseudomonas]|uniref:SdiA-regulated domain-containing protein n=1 Tax=Pseudomonas aphyarum TaxID=2942629 RepID=A0ABT5PQ32_9PSED|nr:SdiA-regulated domain-containing protein [Pseudomonas aphyarum]MDD0971116.1 SdiA-regulated domain-containing protein [Pseudomonas aphyarum]MDD1125918.1 SdiA-regulated domain-containing protein [Pseudomonas aphyarum]